MIVRNIKDVEAIKVKEVQYQGKSHEVKGTSVRWMVHSALGGLEYKHSYAIRYFTMNPGGSFPCTPMITCKQLSFCLGN